MNSTASDVSPRNYTVIIPENEFTMGFEHHYTPYSKGIYCKTTVIANNKIEAIKILILSNKLARQYLGYKYFAILRFILCDKDDSLIGNLLRNLYNYFDENDIEIDEDEEVVSLLESHNFSKLFSSDELIILKDYYRRLIKYQTLFSEASIFDDDYDFECNMSEIEMTKLAKQLKDDCIIFLL